MSECDVLTELPNIGPVLSRNLREAGIDTPERLRELGSKEAFTRIRASVDPGACLMMLYALEAAILGIPDSKLPDDTKADLRAFCKGL